MTNHDLSELFRAFYTQFILRDLFAKIGPGALFLAIVLSRSAFSADFYQIIKNISFYHFVFIIPLCWSIGIGIQGAGSLIPYFFVKDQDSPNKCWYSGRDWQKMYLDCKKSIGQNSMLIYDLERVVIIRETSGIYFGSIFLSSMVVYMTETDCESFITDNGSILFATLLLLIFLFIMHISSTISQFRFMKKYCKDSGC
jgi:hypothetical protein